MHFTSHFALSSAAHCAGQGCPPCVPDVYSSMQMMRGLHAAFTQAKCTRCSPDDFTFPYGTACFRIGRDAGRFLKSFACGIAYAILRVQPPPSRSASLDIIRRAGRPLAAGMHDCLSAGLMHAAENRYYEKVFSFCRAIVLCCFDAHAHMF